jgi:hypothetical protein
MSIINNITLPKIKLKNSLKAHIFEQNLNTTIIDELKKIPNIEEIQTDPELLEFICNLVENMVQSNNRKSKSKIDKKKVVGKIYKQLFNITDEKLNILGGQIEYLHSNKKIKKIPFSKKAYIFLKNFFLTKIF